MGPCGDWFWGRFATHRGQATLPQRPRDSCGSGLARESVITINIKLLIVRNATISHYKNHDRAQTETEELPCRTIQLH